MVVIQPTGFCNIDCAYCYLPNRNDKYVMAQTTVERLFSELFASGWASPRLTVVWHAGEPLVVPPSFYREAFATIERLRPQSVMVAHSFQTNGMLINADWCKFFLEWKVGVGVSIDGPRELHDANRRMRNGSGTFDRAMAGVRTLRDEGVPFHVISVLGSKSLDMADELLDFYIEEGIDHVCFNVEESEGSHVSELIEAGDRQLRYAAFLRRFWQRAREDGRIEFVREIDLAIQRIFRPEEVATRNIQTEPLAMLNVDSRGNVSSFSPELLGLRNPEYGDYLFGNIERDSLATIYDNCVKSALMRDIQAGVDACAVSCDYFSVCGGGAPVNKLSENGSFASTDTGYCALTQKVPTDLILEAYDQLERRPTEPSTAMMATAMTAPLPVSRTP